MAAETIATFSVQRLSILDENGNVDAALMPELTDSDIRRMYELMVLARTFDQQAVNLQREGRLGTYPPILGQEATQVGSAYALQRSDWVFPSFREMGVHLTLGYPPDLLLRYWAGDEEGLCPPEHLNIFPVCVSVSTQIPHAVGAAMAARYRRDPVAMVAYFGDGATSKGDFHEGFNLAGVFKLPTVFICQNNQWAISVPLKRQTSTGSLAQKAIAYGFPGVQVDGNDVFAVYKATTEALARARSGGGPTFIECLTFRMADHTTADDAARYRSAEEVAAWHSRDPLRRLELFMNGKGLWDEEYGRQSRAAAEAAVADAIKAMEAAPPAERAAMFRHTAATMSPRQAAQLEVG
jgi:pyruvate dehydrogenase E1 component subunit alpha